MSEASGWLATALRTTPGPEMATLTLTSGSPLPCRAPAMNGLSSGTLQKTTILAQPMQSCVGGHLRETASRTSAMRTTASMLMPARVEATLTERADALRGADRLGDGLDEGGVAAREALLDESS